MIRIICTLMTLLSTTALLAQQPDPYEMQQRMQQHMESMMRRMEMGLFQDSTAGGNMQLYWSTPDTTIVQFFGPGAMPGDMSLDSLLRTMPGTGLWREELFGLPSPQGGLSPLPRRDMDDRIEELLQQWREQLELHMREEREGRRIYRL